MMEWLEQTNTSARDRADAYGLLPDVDREATTLEGRAARSLNWRLTRPSTADRCF